MSIYLGTSGGVKLQRLASTAFTTTVNSADINIPQKRLELDFPSGTFITGDRVFIEKVTAGTLDFINGYGSSSGTFYVNVDTIGGIKLYTTWPASLTGSLDNALTLAAPSVTYDITLESLGDGLRDLGQVVSFELNTNRATADVTSLGDQFSKSIATLISGSGNISCFWDFAALYGSSGELESAQFLHQLVMRQQLGSNFRAALSLKTQDAQSANESGAEDSQGLFYLINGIITNVAVAFEPSAPIRSEIDFVTTGQIALRYGGATGDLLLQEDSDELVLEQGGGSLLIEDA
jgi:hypothetical protein